MIPETVAKQIFEAAIREERCAELLATLFDGGSAAVNPDGSLTIIDDVQLRGFLGSEEE